MLTEAQEYKNPQKLIRVLMISREFSPFIGGAEIQAQKLSRGLINKGVKVLMTTGWWSWRTPQQETIETIPVFRNFAFWGLFGIKGLRKFGDYIYLVTLFWYLWRHRKEYDLIHVHLLNQAAFSGVLAGQWLKKPTIIKLAASGLYSDIHKMRTNNLALPGSRQMLPVILRANRFVAINSAIVEELLEVDVPKERIVFIPNGIEMDKLALKSDYELQDPIHLVFVGRLHHQKGLDVLLQAFSNIIASRSTFHWRLTLLGDGPLHRELKEMTRRLGIDREVEFCGFVKNVSSYLRTADMFLLPSRSEGLSNALMEAMAGGLPCIVSSVAGNVDLIKGFQNGLLVPPDDDKALADAINRLVKDDQLRRRLGTEAHRTVEDKYSIDKVANMYIDLYHTLIPELN